MRFIGLLAVAGTLLCSSAAADGKDAAPVYILRHPAAAVSSSSASEIPRQIARQIILRRLSADENSNLLESLPEGFDPESALTLIETFGVKSPFLGQDSSVQQQRQLLVALEGVKPDQLKQIEEVLPEAFSKPSFTVADPPSKAANEQFFVDELSHAGVPVGRITRTQALSDIDPNQWTDGVSVSFHDVAVSARAFDDLLASIPQIASLVENGLIEAAIVLLPYSSRSSKLNSWTTKALRPAQGALSDELRKLRVREAEVEAVMGNQQGADSGAFGFGAKDTSANGETLAVAASSPHAFAAASAAAIPACFQSFNACTTQTDGCSGHGACIDKFARSGDEDGLAARADDDAGAAVCFACHCYSTLNRPEDSDLGLDTTQWAGNMCQKKDVSVPFWLLTGFTVTLVGAVSFAIGLLYSVGEEKLPGVIGAGVSRGK